MPIWKVLAVTEQPSITLVRWRIFETNREEHHFVGYCDENLEGRISSAIQGFDPSTGRGVTASSRVYQLEEPAGYDEDALYTWELWSGINQVQSVQDVTEEVVALGITAKGQ